MANKTYDAICQKRVPKYEARIQTDIANGITLESLEEKRRKKTPEEKAIQKKKNENRRKRREKKKAKAALERFNPDQDDEFFYIAGYTFGGAPYGVTWEKMGLDPWESLGDEQEDDVW